MTAATGLIRPPMTGFNYSHNSLCQWSFGGSSSSPSTPTVSTSRTAVFKADRVLMEKAASSGVCAWDSLKFYAGKTLLGNASRLFRKK